MSTVADTKSISPVTPERRRSRGAAALRFVNNNRTLTAGIVITLGLILLGVIAPVIAPYGPSHVDLTVADHSPTWSHIFGTDSFGRDIFSRILYGARIDMLVAVVVVLVSVLIGVPLGATTGFFGGKFIDSVVMRIVDAFQAFPVFVLAIMLVAILGQGVVNVIVAIAFLHFPSYLRLVRSEALSARKSQYATAARCTGNSNSRIIFRHLLPNCLGPVFPQSSLNAGYAILITAGLSFIGVGVSPTTPEWGAMIKVGSDQLLSGEWWSSFFPGLAMVIAVLGFNLLSDGLQDLHDPTRRKRA
jgi:peptide/nickel transport system permease protein